MIQEIEPHKYDPEYRKKDAASEDTALVYNGKAGILTMYKDGSYVLPELSDIEELCGPTCDAYYLFSIDNTGYYQIELPESVNEGISFVKTTDEDPEESELFRGKFIYMSIHRFRELNPVPMVFAGATGFHIRNWRENVRFCGRCGAKTRMSETERASVCTKCGYTVYPQVAPAVIVAV